MKAVIKDQGRRVMEPLAGVLDRLGVSPNLLTGVGLVASIGAAVAIGFARFNVAGLALLLGGVCDMLDGAVARRSGKSSSFGAFLDSTVDRLAEIFFFAGVMIYFLAQSLEPRYAVLAFFAASGSLMVSYTRARAEGLGLSCSVGLMERPERIVLLLIATFVGPMGIRVALWILTVLVFVTTLQRMVHVYRKTRLP